MRLEVLPGDVLLTALSQFRFRAEMVLADGTRTDVTASAAWASGNPLVLTSLEQGLVRAENIATDSETTTVSATASGLTGAATVEVRPECFGGELDVCFVLDVSGSMNLKDGAAITRLEGAKLALNQALLAAKAGDRFGLATFSTLGRIEVGLTPDIAAVQAAVAALGASGQTNVGYGLMLGETVMQAARPGITQVLVCVADGGNNVCAAGQGPLDVADRLKADGVIVVSVGLAVAGNARDCRTGDVLATDLLTAISSGQSYFVQTTAELSALLTGLRRLLCTYPAAGLGLALLPP